MEKEKTQYGILMSRVLLAPDLYIFKPLSVVQGVVQKMEYKIDVEGEMVVTQTDIFIDALGNSYNLSSNVEALDSDEELSVFHITTEKELGAKYGEDKDIGTLLDCFFSEVTVAVHLGIYDEEKDAVNMIDITLGSIAQAILNRADGLDKGSDILNKALEQNDGSGIVYMNMNKFEQLLKIQDPQKLREELQKIYDDVNSINEHFGIKEEAEEEKKENGDKVIDINDMKAYFDKKIIGQEEAKKDIIKSVYMNSLSSDKNDRTTCLLLGPTGSGKTLIAETLQEYLNVPMAIIDTTQITAPGYKGADIEDFLSKLLVQTNGDLDKAEHGIVVFDEIDKKGGSYDGGFEKSVLHSLLAFIQGTTYTVTYKQRDIQFDTSKLTIFATGAFTNVAEAKQANNTTIGFLNGGESKKEDIKYEKLSIQDLAKLGNIPIELLGRFTVLSQLSGHTKESLKQIMLSENGDLMRHMALLSKINIELKWDESYIDAVVNKAFELKTGARSLKQTVVYSLKEAIWEVITHKEEYKKIYLTGETVLNNNMCILIKKNDEKVNLNDIINKSEETKTNQKTLK